MCSGWRRPKVVRNCTSFNFLPYLLGTPPLQPAFQIEHACLPSCTLMSDALRSYGLQPTRLVCPWNFPGKYNGVSCHFLLQGIFLTQGLNPRLLLLLHGQSDSLLLEAPGKPLQMDQLPSFCPLSVGRYSSQEKTFSLNPQYHVVVSASSSIFPSDREMSVYSECIRLRQ